MIWDLIWHIFSNVQFNQTYFSRLVFNLGWHFLPELGFDLTYFLRVGIFSLIWDLTWHVFPDFRFDLTYFPLNEGICSDQWFDLYNGIYLYMWVCFRKRSWSCWSCWRGSQSRSRKALKNPVLRWGIVYGEMILKSEPSKAYYRTSRYFSEDLILALLERLFSSLRLCIANNTPCMDIMCLKM